MYYSVMNNNRLWSIDYYWSLIYLANFSFLLVLLLLLFFAARIKFILIKTNWMMIKWKCMLQQYNSDNTGTSVHFFFSLLCIVCFISVILFRILSPNNKKNIVNARIVFHYSGWLNNWHCRFLSPEMKILSWRNQKKKN